eukprot:5602341-Alexandrium_andersonii.AAC.1
MSAASGIAGGGPAAGAASAVAAGVAVAPGVPPAGAGRDAVEGTAEPSGAPPFGAGGVSVSGAAGTDAGGTEASCLPSMVGGERAATCGAAENEP